MTNNEEFAKLGMAIGDAIHRLPPDYRIEIDLMNSGPFICLTDPDGCGVDYKHADLTLTDEIAKAVDAAIEDSKRRGE